METLKIIVTSIISSGVVGIILKIYFEQKFKNKFSKDLEKYKANIEIDKNVTLEISNEQLQIYKEITETIYRSRNESRYIVALLSDYYCSLTRNKHFNHYSKFLQKGDNSLSFGELKRKITDLIRDVEEAVNKSTEFGYRNRLLIDDVIFKYIHDYKYVIIPIRDLDFWLKSKIFEDKPEFNLDFTRKMYEIEGVYNEIDIFHKEILIALQVNYGIRKNQ